MTETFGHGYTHIANPMPPLPDTVHDRARACVLRHCPDDAELILNVLGLL